MTGRWQSQWARVQRWHSRASLSQDPEDKFDFIDASFENASHLRDWLQDTNGASKNEPDHLFDQAQPAPK